MPFAIDTFCENRNLQKCIKLLNYRGLFVTFIEYYAIKKLAFIVELKVTNISVSVF